MDKKEKKKKLVLKKRGSGQHLIFRMVGSPLYPLCQPHPAKGGDNTERNPKNKANNATMKPTMLVHRLKTAASTYPMRTSSLCMPINRASISLLDMPVIKKHLQNDLSS